MPIRIDGLSALNNMLKNESVRTAKRYLVNVAKPAAEVVLEAMRATAPVGLTGELKAELTSRNTFSEHGLTIEIGPANETFWGMFQEFGTKDQPAQHWMARAWAGCQDKCLSVFATEALARLADMEDKKK